MKWNFETCSVFYYYSEALNTVAWRVAYKSQKIISNICNHWIYQTASNTFCYFFFVETCLKYLEPQYPIRVNREFSGWASLRVGPLYSRGLWFYVRGPRLDSYFPGQKKWPISHIGIFICITIAQQVENNKIINIINSKRIYVVVVWK